MATIFLNNRYLPAQKGKISIFDAGFLYGESIYETLRTKEGQIINLKNHLKRLKASAKIVNIPLPPLKNIETWLQETVHKNNLWKQKKESRIRLTISGGIHTYDSKAKNPTILITVSPLPKISARVFLSGVSVVTFQIDRPIPQAKTTNLIPTLLARQFMRQKKAYEVFLIDHRGFVTEGSISNFFIVKNNQLIIAASQNLPGTTQKRIIQLAKTKNWKIIAKNNRPADFYQADEIFICNAPRGIIPVTKVDNHLINHGQIGHLTKIIWESLNNTL
ncbi:MAG: branched-chain amino acid aminotransferase, branched-chain amino acid aminotransferase [Candidatus Peregrinibacteria bacterium GW2011_GWE2_39_6]|nr:MAG: branched-chain amino acid aminotransferase, branched-chain amino acid aminotransferase [Candidatus Peregrinibacteria bacterium GW2011_GWF2_39_17]KKR26600.1 MAG: branched-chain amino acid aminotransferase, branched-chain amino acid aminotransferase [Candidatus Peregrinibacteria bacterium GW2011_GWE2_39_6]HCW32496.1 hypothetical protein [Candidatus Peregrinibacteria bacterium]